jgi:hypothetical protein
LTPKKNFFSIDYIKMAVTPVTPVTPSRNHLLSRVSRSPGVTTAFFWLVTPVTPDDYQGILSQLKKRI